ncbi:MAG: nickel-dependent hydrogenase large subunit [Candidatus Bathyarchaeia archaeon]
MSDELKEVEYKEFTRFALPVGPVHPSLKEPIHLKVVVSREEILDVDLRLGHAHRGVEALAETRNLIQNLYLIERICGICSHSHTTCFVQAVEEIGGIKPSERALYLRTLIFELERIHSHLLLLGVMAYQIGFDTLFMYTWTAREKVLDIFEEVTGNRILHSMNIIGGVRWDLTDKMMEKLAKTMDEVEKDVHNIYSFFKDKTVEKRLSNVGFLSYDDARELCLVGPTARGSGLTFDVRKDDPYAAYSDLKDSFSVISRKEGDAYARVEVRILELFEALNLTRTIIDRLPNGPISPKESAIRLMSKIPVGETVSRVEAPRGELLYFVRTDGRGGIKRLKVRTPTLANIIGLKRMLVGCEVADIPVVLASIDPCISCTNRVTIIDQRSPDVKVVSMEELRRLKLCSL